jgi:hypothetical protein
MCWSRAPELLGRELARQPLTGNAEPELGALVEARQGPRRASRPVRPQPRGPGRARAACSAARATQSGPCGASLTSRTVPTGCTSFARAPSPARRRSRTGRAAPPGPDRQIQGQLAQAIIAQRAGVGHDERSASRTARASRGPSSPPCQAAASTSRAWTSGPTISTRPPGAGTGPLPRPGGSGTSGSLGGC